MADPYDTPAGIPPPGVVPNLDDPQAQGTLFPAVVGVGVVILALCVLAVVLATIQRLRSVPKLTATDCVSPSRNSIEMSANNE